MTVPEKQLGMLHGFGKANGSMEFGGKENASLSESLPSAVDTWSELANLMQREKEKKQVELVHPKVNPCHTFPCTNPHDVTDLLESKEEIPPGFKGQAKRGDHMAKDFNIFEGHMGIHEKLVHSVSQKTLLDAFMTPSEPFLEEFMANNTVVLPNSYSQHVHLLTPKNQVTPSLKLADISNHPATRQGSFASGTKWSRILCSSPGKKDAMLLHAGKKRTFEVDSDQVEAPNKKYIVSQDDKENSKILAATGSQPCQGL